MWQEKYEDSSRQLQELNEENKLIRQKLDSFKSVQLEREAEFIKENSEIMRKKEIIDNEWKYLREQLSQKQAETMNIYSELEGMRSETLKSNEKIVEEFALKERELNIASVMKIGKYKVDIENINQENRTMQMNFISLQKEKENILAQNQNLTQEKHDRQVLTQQLFEYMKSKIVEKHSENNSLQQMNLVLKHSMSEIKKQSSDNSGDNE